MQESFYMIDCLMGFIEALMQRDTLQSEELQRSYVVGIIFKL